MAPLINWNPWSSVLMGQNVQALQDEAILRGREESEDQALKEAAGQMGQNEYLTGYEGVEGAVRPNYLRELFARNPKAALDLESRLSAPFAVEREIRKAGEIERKKKEADAAVYMNMFKNFLESGYGGPLEPPSGSSEPPYIPSGVTPPPSSSIDNLPAVESTFELTPQGPRMGFKRQSPFDTRIKAEELKNAQAAEARQGLQAAHENVRKAQDGILSVQRAMQTREIPWDDGLAQIEALKGQLANAVQQRDQLLKGPTKPAPALSAGPVAPAAPGASVPSGAPKFTEKEQADIAIKEREQKQTAANKEIVDARLGAEKIVKYKRQVKELFDLVTKQDIGHPAMEEVPGAATMLTMNRANAQVKKLAEAIINMFAEPGQSQMMNTIIERQMQGAVVPNIFTDPQLNKINAAVLRSNVEHLGNFPTFLEKWQKSHSGTLDGAAEAWIDYTDNNPLYTYSKDARGRVTVKENSHVLPLDKWMSLRASGGIRNIGDRVFIKQQDGSWVEK